jgi:D-xylose transport system ATP-binding protein
MLLKLNSITKLFPGIKALDNVNFDLIEGECHAIVGENGAGKSTLMKILSGVYPSGSYSGEILIDDEQKHFYSVKDAEKSGISIIFQELSLIKNLSVAENIFLGREPSRFGFINRESMYRETQQILQDLQVSIDPRIKVGELSIGKQQIIEIAKALSKRARILLLDEPTSALTDSEIENLFQILKKLKNKGVGMIYISHKLEEVFSVSDRITVLRDGKTIKTDLTKNLTKNQVISLMVGREVEDIFPKTQHNVSDVVLEVKNLEAYDAEESDKRIIKGVSFYVRKGEVLGIAGLMGAGRTELLRAIFGDWEGKREGEVFIEGKKVTINSPSDAIRNRIAFVTEDRKRYGLILDKNILENTTLASLESFANMFVTDKINELKATERLIDSLKIKTTSAFALVENLSGGNQQKVVLGKWLLTNPKIFFLDEPTRGIDVGAKQDFYLQINKLAKEGLAVVLVSSELPELLGLSDRILVLHEGKQTAEFLRSEATPEKIMQAAMGL